MSDAEMAQLIAALEESERTAREEAEARKAMHVSSAGSHCESPTGIQLTMGSPANHASER